MMMPVPLMTRRSVDAVAAVNALRTSSAATFSSKRLRSLRTVSRCATTPFFAASRPKSRITPANASLDRIRSTDGMLRSAESPEDGLDLGMGAYCRRPDRDQTGRRAGQARRRHPQAEEQVRPVLQRDPEVSADARTASARGLHLRAGQAED